MSGQLLLRESSDSVIAQSNISLKAGRWHVESSVESAENKLEFNKILGYHQTHRAGFGSLSIPEVPPKHSHAYRRLLSSLVNEFEEEKYHAKAVQLQIQGQWTKWCNYVKQDFSWKTLLGLPPNLLSFCLGATYDTLPSPSNLHRWHLSPETSCFLCKKNICTTAHVLGACKVALKQGRYTYRHDSVLEMVVLEFKLFLSSLSTNITNSTQIKFVKEGTVPKPNKRNVCGILHEASDWILLHNLEKLVIPSFLAVSSLRPDILVFSVSVKKVVLIELTCPCEENMEEWHHKKFHKYEPLAEMMRYNGWSVDIFPIEVGARGYYATSLRYCFIRLGLGKKGIRKLLKQLSSQSLKSSFEIWLARDCYNWSNSHTPTSAISDVPSANLVPPIVSNRSFPKEFSKHQKSSTKAECIDFYRGIPEIRQSGLLNKGNTCYVNATLQCFSTMVCFWSNLTMFSTTLSPFVSAFVKIMSLLRNSKGPIDPSHFLKHLHNVAVKSGKTDFNIFQQQDAAEVLGCILNELLSVGVSAENMVSISIRTTITCNKCNQINLKEEPTSILQVPVEANLQSSLNAFLAPESLRGGNSYYCNICQSSEPADVCQNICSVGKFLILQTKRFLHHGSYLAKHLQKIACSSPLHVPVLNGDDSIKNEKYKLLATVNHTGSLDRGHYTAYIRRQQDSWLHCNDAAVVLSEESKVNNDSSYVYFYEKI